MLQLIRDYAKGWFSAIVFAGLVVVVLLWSLNNSYFATQHSNVVIAKVNGAEITKQQFAIAYERTKHQLQAQLGVVFPLSEDKEFAVKQRVLQGLIDNKIMQQAALTDKFIISPEQINNYLENMPDFQDNGSFSVSKFEEVLASSWYSANELFDLINTNLLIAQPKIGITSTAFTLNNEVKYAMKLINQERHLRYVMFDSLSLPDSAISISQHAISDYYNQHHDEFTVPERVSLDYLMISLADFLNKAHIDDNMIRNYYNDNINSFTKLVVRNHRNVHIVQPLPEVYSKVKAVLLQQKADELFAAARDRLAELTYENPNALEPAAKALGLPIKHTSLFAKDQDGIGIAASPKVRNIAFTHEVMQLQHNSDLVSISPDTVLVVRLKDHLPSATLPLRSVQQQIKYRLTVALREQKLIEYTNLIYNKLHNNEADNATVTQQYNLLWHDLGFVGRYANNVHSAILELAFQLPDPNWARGKVQYGLTKLPKGYAIVAVDQSRFLKSSVQREDVFTKRLENINGTMDYGCYKNVKTSSAKIIFNKPQ